MVVAYQDHLEGARLVTSVDIAGSTKHDPVVDYRPLNGAEARGNGNTALVTGDGVPNQDLELLPVVEEDEPMAAAEDSPFVDVVELQCEAAPRDAVRRLESRREQEAAQPFGEETEEGSAAAVAGAEAAEEGGVRDEAAPVLADEGGAG